MLKIDSFKSIKVKYKNKKIEYDELENLIMNVIQKISNSNEKKHFFISVEKKLTFILAIIYFSINEYIKNACNEGNNILNDIKKGDKLVLKAKEILVFDRVENFNGRDYIVGIGKNNCKCMIPIENRHDLTKYSGSANRINKYKNNNITKEFISDLGNIEKHQFIGDIINSTIIVVENKEELYSIMNQLSIEYNGTAYNISEMFPYVYYSSEDKFSYFKGNSIKQNSIIKFTVNSSVALDIIRTDENIKNILFMGSSSYRNALETEIRQMDMYDSIDKILLVDTWESNFDFTLIDDEFQIYALTKNVILDNINLYKNDMKFYYESELQQNNYNLMLNLLNKEINIFEVDDGGKINKQINDIIINLKSLFDFSQDNMYVLDFLKMSYYLCNKLERTIVPLKESKENTYSIGENIESMKKNMELFSHTRTEYIIMNDILNKFKEIIEAFNSQNPKNEFLKQNYNNKKNYLLGIKNKSELNAVQIYFGKYPSCRFTTRMINKKNKIYNENNVIIPSYIDPLELNLILGNNISKLNILVYEREKNRINFLIKQNYRMMEYIDKNNMLVDYFDKVNNKYFGINTQYIVRKELDNKLDSEELIRIEKNVDNLIEENLLNICLNKTQYHASENGNNTSVKKFIMFEDGNYSFLTNYYKANVLEKNDIVLKESSDIKINDNIVYTLNKINGEEDIIKIILKKLLKVKIFKDRYEQYFLLNRLWKDELINYIEKYDLSEENICNEFRIYGRLINKVTINNWLYGNIIGPKDTEDIRIVSRIVNSDNLNQKIEEVITACLYERKIQIKVRKALAQIIISSVASTEISTDNEENEIRSLIRSMIDDIKKYAYIGRVISIKDITENMNIQYVNRVIEREG